jgi:5'-AMP-activated protein kinase catalytic alpha subunit
MTLQDDPDQRPGLAVNHYELGETIGSGSFGKVKKARHKITGHEVAIKILNRKKIKSMEVVNKTRREIENALRFRHPHIIKMYQVHSSPTDLFLVMEYVPGGELFDYICANGRLPEDESRRFFQQIISGVDCCHRQKVVHRDLKPENLLLDKNMNVRIADFGLSNILTDGEFLRTSCGSPNYAAPEVISGKLYAGPEVDIWSCGVILYALLCGTLPFDDDNHTRLFAKIKRGNYETPANIKNSPVESLIAHMLKTNSMERATIKDILEHPWFRVNLKDYLFPAPGQQLQMGIDVEACQEVASKFGVCPDIVRQIVEEHLESPDLNQNEDPSRYLVAYRLIIDGKILQSQEPDFYLAPNKTSLLNLNVPKKAHPERMHELLDSGPADMVGAGQQMTKTASTRQRPRSKWHLGIRSQSNSMHVMKEVYRSLHELGFLWRNISFFRIRVKMDSKRYPGRHEKMNITLYRSPRCSERSPDYLLDFSSCQMENEREQSGDNSDGVTSHSTMEFFEMCSKIINKLAMQGNN